MIWMYLCSVVGFYLFAAVSYWARFERSNWDIQILKDFLAQWQVHFVFSFIFGWFGPLFNFDAVASLGKEFWTIVLQIPDGGPIFRSIAIGLGGPLAAAKLFSLGSDNKSHRPSGTQVDDITLGPRRTEGFWEASKKLFGI